MEQGRQGKGHSKQGLQNIEITTHENIALRVLLLVQFTIQTIAGGGEGWILLLCGIQDKPTSLQPRRRRCMNGVIKSEGGGR